jgi:hypothetical protein
VNQRSAARRLWHSLPLLIAPLLFCAGRPVEHPQWKADWNVRVDASADLMSHPCGDFAFDPWADAFLDGCGEAQTQAEAECRLRSDWVWERSRQCEVWQSWLLRNHNQRERIDASEPETRVE